MTFAQQKKAAVKWSRKRLAALLAETAKRGPDKGEKVWSPQAAANQVIVEAQREFNIGCADAIKKALKIEYRPDTEEEIEAWEKGETE